MMENLSPVRKTERTQQVATEFFVLGLFMGELITNVVQVSHDEHFSTLLVRPPEQGAPQFGSPHTYTATVAQPVLVHANCRHLISHHAIHFQSWTDAGRPFVVIGALMSVEQRSL